MDRSSLERRMGEAHCAREGRTAGRIRGKHSMSRWGDVQEGLE